MTPNLFEGAADVFLVLDGLGNFCVIDSAANFWVLYVPYKVIDRNQEQ